MPPVRAFLAALAVTAGLLVAPPAWADDVVNTAPPTVSGRAVHGAVLTADPGSWQPTGVTFGYRWLRDSELIRGADATRRSYRLGSDDLHHRISVRVIATDDDGHRGDATSAATRQVRAVRSRTGLPPTIEGVQRFGRTVSATAGRWSARPASVRYQWLRNGRPITGATGRRYTSHRRTSAPGCGCG